jgi:hypothetical protein
MPKVLFLASFAILLFIVEQLVAIWIFVFVSLHIGKGVIRSWELIYHITNSSLMLVAVIALGVAWRQSREAENTRLATVYMNITEQWESVAVASSRMLINKLNENFNNACYTDAHKTLSNNVQEYIEKFLNNLEKSNRSDWRRYTRILAFLEHMGVLCEKGYVKKEDIFGFMASTIIHQVDLSMNYIKAMQVNHSTVYSKTLYLYREAIFYQESLKSRS